MPRKVEQSIDVGDREPLRALRDLHELVARAYLALLDHTKIKSRPAVRHQQRRNAWLVHAYPDAVAGDPRLEVLLMRNRSPMHTSLSGRPSTVKFSPNWPKVKSLRPRSRSQ